MESDPSVVEAFRERLARVVERWRPAEEEVQRFHGRLQATLARVKADPSPLTLVEQCGAAIAEAPTPFEAFAHLAMLEEYARAADNDRLQRYCTLVREVFRLLAGARAPGGTAEPTAGESLADLKMAGRTIAAVATMDRDEPRTTDARLLALAESGGIAAAIAALVLQMLAEVRGELPS